MKFSENDYVFPRLPKSEEGGEYITVGDAHRKFGVSKNVLLRVCKEQLIRVNKQIVNNQHIWALDLVELKKWLIENKFIKG